MSKKFVYAFSEGNAKMRELLGGKGANLAEMTVLGMPVPQGFTVTKMVSANKEKSPDASLVPLILGC